MIINQRHTENIISVFEPVQIGGSNPSTPTIKNQTVTKIFVTVFYFV
jgi:hypothetical protein